MTLTHVPRSEWADFKAMAPDVDNLVRTLGSAAAQSGLDRASLERVKLRASQINGCAFCVQFHVLAAEQLGIAPDKLNLLAVWREAPMFSARERAALAWTEALTLVTQGVDDEVYAEVTAEFSAQELAYLSSAIGAINVWNRLGVAYRWTPPARQRQPRPATA
jgi:AhpD family alkylhydroperoxidase